MTVPAARVRVLNDQPIRSDGQMVLYWMIGARRLESNFALQHAVDLAVSLDTPLVVLEPLDVSYPWASDRLHRFVLDGMADNARAAAASAARYLPFVEAAPGHGRGLLQHLSSRAAVVVTDDVPAFVIPGLLQRAARQSFARLVAVDGNGLIPLALHERAFTTARAFRAFAQRTLRRHIADVPELRPLDRLPRARRIAREALPQPWADDAGASSLAQRRWRRCRSFTAFSPAPVTGGSRAAARRLDEFLATGLPRYAAEHTDPDADCTSRLSPYLHFGHISTHQVFSALMTRERWTTRRLGPRASGRRDGWWGVGDGANRFLDQLVVWRELALNGGAWLPDCTSYASLPEWARATLETHRHDPRRRYALETLDSASTHDEVWNAAQRQLVRDGCSTATCACSGRRRSSSGHPIPPRHSTGWRR